MSRASISSVTMRRPTWPASSLRVNLSDLAAKGPRPTAISSPWPGRGRYGDAERRAFAAGLAEDQAEFGVKLVGGWSPSRPWGP